MEQNSSYKNIGFFREPIKEDDPYWIHNIKTYCYKNCKKETPHKKGLKFPYKDVYICDICGSAFP